jgi:hypothetical protein
MMKRLRLLVIVLCLMTASAIPGGCGGGGKPINSLPVANAGGDLAVQVGETCYYTGGAADADGTIVKYEWDFDGDGVYDWSSDTSCLTTHVFNTAGSYTSVLRVTDNDGATDIDVCFVDVMQVLGSLDISGVWNGEWYRSDGEEEGTLSAILVQTEGSLSGEMTITSVTFDYTRETTVSGSVEGSEVVFGTAIAVNGDTVTIDYNGTVYADGDFMEGTYTMSTGYSGNWTAAMGSAPTTPASSVPEVPENELISASADNLIEFQACGTGSLDQIKLTISSNADGTLMVTIVPGTLFMPQSADLSGMIVTKTRVITLSPNETNREVYAEAASTNMLLDVPGSDDLLVPDMDAVTDDLAKLCSLTDFQQETFRVRQFSVWTLTDNPRPDAYPGIGYFGFGSGPSDEEMTTIETLLDKAGIQAEKYWAFQEPVPVELLDAIDRGLITVSACGAGSLEIIELSLTSLSNESLEVTISPGTVFNSQSASIQSMLIIENKLVVVYPYETIETVEVAAACANMVREVPSGSDILIISSAPVSGDLMKLLELPEFYTETYRVQQFAIWTITDNPAPGGYIGIGTFGIGTGPSSEEMDEIRYLFETAGIATGQYQALN